MIGLFIFLGGFLLTYRMVYKRAADHHQENYSWWDGEDRLMLAILAALTALLWPITLAFLLVFKFVTPKTQQEKHDEREAKLLELEAAVAEREAEIRRLEREAGIGGVA